MKLTVLAIPMALLSAAAGATGPYDFSCDDVKQLVRLIEAGPDAVVRKFTDYPSVFTKGAINGWTCLTDPLPPLRNNRIYLKAIECVATNDDKLVSEDEMADAGATFMGNVRSFQRCFGENLLNETPKSYARKTRGEGIVGVLSNTFMNRHILVEYGYFRNTSPPSPLYWQTIVGYSSDER
jgi:hypothetical protein